MRFCPVVDSVVGRLPVGVQDGCHDRAIDADRIEVVVHGLADVDRVRVERQWLPVVL